MKFERVVLLLGVCLAMPGFIHADAEADHNTLRKLKVLYEDSISKGDLDALAPYLAKNFTGILATGDEIKNIDQLKEFWGKIKNNLGPGGSLTEKLDPDLSDLYGDIAIAHGRARTQLHTSSNKEINLDTTWTIVAHREQDGWKLVRVQSTMNPLKNPLIDLLIQKARLMFGLGGLILGILIGLLIPFRRSKRA